MGGINKFLKQIGDTPANAKPSAEILKNEYIRIRDKLGKVPTLEEIKKNTILRSAYPFHEYPLTKLQKECGNIPNCDRSYTKEDLINAYINLSKDIGHSANSTEIRKFLGEKYNLRIRHTWGSYKIFIKEIKDKYNIPYRIDKIEKENYIKILKLIKNLLEISGIKNELSYQDIRKLKYDNMPIINADYVSNYFSGWKNVKKLLNENN